MESSVLFREWRAARIERFTEIQRRTREWINFAEIAEWCADESGVVPNEEARAAAYQKLQQDLLEGDFEENGVSKVLYLHPYTSKARMTRRWLTDMMERFDQTTINSQYLAHCWIRREFFGRWLAKHRMQASPPRFEPKWQPRKQLVAHQQESKNWHVKSGHQLTPNENAVFKVIADIWPGGIIDQKAKARDERIRNQLRTAKQSPVSPKTIQRTLRKIDFD
jgi:hypothetical protein